MTDKNNEFLTAAIHGFADNLGWDVTEVLVGAALLFASIAAKIVEDEKKELGDAS